MTVDVVKSVKQPLTQPLYDSAQVATSGTTKLSFFSTPYGQGTTIFGSGNKNLCDTNLQLAGQIPAGWEFTIYGVALVLWTTAATMAADMALVLANSWFELFLGGGSQPALQVPAKLLPGGAGVSGFAASTQSTIDRQAAHNGEADPRAIFTFKRPQTIFGGRGFGATLNWATAPSPTAAVNCTVVLHGDLIREI